MMMISGSMTARRPISIRRSRLFNFRRNCRRHYIGQKCREKLRSKVQQTQCFTHKWKKKRAMIA